jgi:hypothetical protein
MVLVQGPQHLSAQSLKVRILNFTANNLLEIVACFHQRSKHSWNTATQNDNTSSLVDQNICNLHFSYPILTSSNKKTAFKIPLHLQVVSGNLLLRVHKTGSNRSSYYLLTKVLANGINPDPHYCQGHRPWMLSFTTSPLFHVNVNNIDHEYTAVFTSWLMWTALPSFKTGQQCTVCLLEKYCQRRA